MAFFNSRSDIIVAAVFVVSAYVRFGEIVDGLSLDCSENTVWRIGVWQKKMLSVWRMIFTTTKIP